MARGLPPWYCRPAVDQHYIANLARRSSQTGEFSRSFCAAWVATRARAAIGLRLSMRGQYI